MTICQSFNKFLENIKVDNSEKISDRYHEITKKLNKTFRNTDSETANCLQVGSYGRYTGIKGISDLDMLYIMPSSKWNEYKNEPDKLLKDVRAALEERYPNTKIKDDRLVVDVFFKDFKFEVQPVFEEVDENGETIEKFPDTKYGYYRITKPRQEQDEMTSFRQNHGDTHRLLCKMVRSWKNNVGLAMCGLLIDTLAHRFLSNHQEYDNAGPSNFDVMCRDFFEYLKNEPKQDHYQALGSGQDVKVKKHFQRKAKKAYNKAVDAISETNENKRNDIWREIFGRKFPKAVTAVAESREFSASVSYTDPEQFIEDVYPVDIRYNATLDCEVKRDGYREAMLSYLLMTGQRVSRVRTLDFTVKTDVPQPYEVKWKVRNVGDEAKRRNCLRGEIIDSNRMNGLARHESADFCGPHYVECYIVKDGIVVARDRIDVPIK